MSLKFLFPQTENWKIQFRLFPSTANIRSWSIEVGGTKSVCICLFHEGCSLLNAPHRSDLFTLSYFSLVSGVEDLEDLSHMLHIPPCHDVCLHCSLLIKYLFHQPSVKTFGSILTFGHFHSFCAFH